MKISVVIPTCDRPEYLKKALASLVIQATGRGFFEVIVVDNGSLSDAASFVQDFAGGIRQLRCIVEPKPGLHNARHRGMHAAAGEILAFIDDDVEVAEGWVSSLFEAFSSPDVVLVGGNNLPAFAVPPPAWLEHWWNQPVYKGRALGYLSILDFGKGVFEIDPAFVWGCNFSIRKEQLIQYGGFHPDAFPAEMLRYRGDGETAVSDAVRRSGARTLFHSGASVSHHVPAERMTVGYFKKRAFAQGISDSFTQLRQFGLQGMALKIKIRIAITRLYNFVANIKVMQDPVERELYKIKYAVNLEYLKGFLFHQHEVSTDQNLLEWVLKADYYR